MATLLFSPDEGYSPVLTLNGKETALRGNTFSFAVNGDTRLEVRFEKAAAEEPQEVRFPREFQTNWASTDGVYSLSMMTRTLTLKRDGQPLDVKVSCFEDPAYGGTTYYFLEFGGERYELSYFGNVNALMLRSRNETIVFVYAKLPAYRAGKSLYHTYAETGEGDRSGKTVTISEQGFFWGEEEVHLLENILFGGSAPALVLAGGRVYALFVFQRLDGGAGYDLALRDPLTGMEYRYSIK